MNGWVLISPWVLLVLLLLPGLIKLFRYAQEKREADVRAFGGAREPAANRACRAEKSIGLFNVEFHQAPLDEIRAQARGSADTAPG
jgi:hypothetical protein